ncbi:UNVERIFIED_CONTAM: sugar-specific transcriptional regulator TrmB [Acetivibrio alkalicellulosi]
MDFIELLVQFNLTRQEAAIYLTLLSEGELNGYEVAKKTGISRSNTYTSLAALVEKGGAYVIDSTIIKYTPVPFEEFSNNKIRKLEKTKQDLMNSIPNKREEKEGYITIKGEHHIIDKMKNMILEAKERIYISASKDVIEELFTEIEIVLKRGIKLVLITDYSFSIDGAKVYLIEEPRQQIRLITDSVNVLTGDIDDGEHSSCLFSKKKNLVDLLKDSLKNEIKLIEIVRERKDLR